MLHFPSSYLKSPWSNLISQSSTLLPPSSVKRMGYLTQKLLKIAWFPTTCPQAPVAPLTAFSRSDQFKWELVISFTLNSSLLKSSFCLLFYSFFSVFLNPIGAFKYYISRYSQILDPPPPEMLILHTQYKHFWSYPRPQTCLYNT